MNSDNVNKLVEELGKRIFEAGTNLEEAVRVIDFDTFDTSDIKSKLTAAEWDRLAFDHLFSMGQERAERLAAAEGLIARGLIARHKTTEAA